MTVLPSNDGVDLRRWVEIGVHPLSVVTVLPGTVPARDGLGSVASLQKLLLYILSMVNSSAPT